MQTMQQLPPAQPIAPKAESSVPAAAPVRPGARDPKALETFRKLGLAAMKIIYNAETSKQLVEMMRSAADSPPQAVAAAADVVLGQMAEKVQGLDPKLVYTVAPAVIAFLMELAGAAGVFKPTQQIMQQAIALVGRQAGTQPSKAAPAAPMQGLVGSQMQAPVVA